MSRDAAIAAGCLALAFASIVAALRCLAERLLPSALVYTLLALALLGGAARAATAVF
jgi:hypothetical protein